MFIDDAYAFDSRFPFERLAYSGQKPIRDASFVLAAGAGPAGAAPTMIKIENAIYSTQFPTTQRMPALQATWWELAWGCSLLRGHAGKSKYVYFLYVPGNSADVAMHSQWRKSLHQLVKNKRAKT